MIKSNPHIDIYLEELLGKEKTKFLCAKPEQKSIRLNTLKIQSLSDSDFLNSNKQLLKNLAFTDIGYSIKSDPQLFSQALDFFKGYYAFQGASSQIPPIVLNPRPGEKVLDMAASPGSKTTQIAGMMNNQGMLVINDSNINRMQALNTNTQRSGMINHCIYYLEGARLGRIFPEYFDKVLLDTPCTGLGTIATKKEVLSWWNFEKLKKLTAIQNQLLISAIKAVKVGGEIVYSTCSVAPEENELLINDIIKKYPLKILSPGMDKLTDFDSGFTHYKDQRLTEELKFARRVWPHKHGMEGFFIIRLKKISSYYNKNNPAKIEYINTLDSNSPLLKGVLTNLSENWGIDSSIWNGFRFIRTADRVWLFNNSIRKIVKEGFTNGGLLLAEERRQLWKLSHQAIQFLGNNISKRRIILAQDKLKELFLNGFCSSGIEENGYFALEISENPSAVVYNENNHLKIKLPHPFKF